MPIRILHGLCRLCDACIAVCPPMALSLRADRLHWDATRCENCLHCLRLCPAGALAAVPEPAENPDGPV
jgi:dissimilatory sulfite reductase (desulfoviridin) alpha/beta subunit